MSEEANSISQELHRYFMTFLRGFESGLEKGYTAKMSSDDIVCLFPNFCHYRYIITEPIREAVNNMLSIYIRIYDSKDDHKFKIVINLEPETMIKSWYEFLVASKYGYEYGRDVYFNNVKDFYRKAVKATFDDDPFDLGYRLGSELREMIQDLRGANNRDERLKWVLGIEVLRILMINDIATNKNSPLAMKIEYIDRLDSLISNEDRVIFENYMAMLRSAGVHHSIAHYIDILAKLDPSKYGIDLLRHLIEKGEIRLRRDGLYVKGKKVEPPDFSTNDARTDRDLWKMIHTTKKDLYVRGRKIDPLTFIKSDALIDRDLWKTNLYDMGKKIGSLIIRTNGVLTDRNFWERIYTRYVLLHIKYGYYEKILNELIEYGYDPVDAGRVILQTILYNKDIRDRDWNLADEVMRFSSIKIRGRDGKQVDLIEEIIKRRPDLVSMIINKVVENEPISPMAIDYLMRKIGDYVSEKEKIAMLNKHFIKALKMITSDSGVSRDKIPWFSIVSIVAKYIPRLENAIYYSSGWKTIALMRDGDGMCIPLYLESRGGSIGGIFGLYYYDEDYGEVLVPIKLDDIDIIGRMSKKDIEKIWREMKELFIDPEASDLVELVELREGIKIPITNIYDLPMPLSSDMIEALKTLAKKLPIAAIRVS